MSTEFNPYAPPKANVEEVPQGAVWRDGDTILLRPGTIWPTRCVKCNLPAVQPVKARWVSWHSPWLYFLILLNLIIYLLIASMAQKREKVFPGLCVAHNQRRNRVIAGAWLAFLISLALILGGLHLELMALGIAGVLVLLLAFVVGIVGSRIVYATHIDKEWVRLKGCGEAFLSSVPRR